MNCVLGFDGGGTKTECVVMNDAGEIVARAKGPASNPARIGFPTALSGVVQAADAALRLTGSPVEVVALCAGLAGTGNEENQRRMFQLLSEKFPAATIRVCTDLELPLLALPDGPAIVLVVGTGSAAVGRNAAGTILREGGRGPTDSDEGSAFDIGRSAIAAARRNDSNEAADLARQILRHLGAGNWPDVDAAISKNADSVYPRVFPVVAAAADTGNALAQTFLAVAAEQLAAMAARLAERLGLSQHPFPLAKVGGTVGRSKYFDAAIDRELLSRAPLAVISAPEIDAPATAARIALQAYREKVNSQS